MTTTEQPLLIPVQGDRLVGVLARPAQPAAALAMLIVVGGPQYRAGSHRQFVDLARRLAGAGYPTLRFDVRGMGDSEGDARSFEALDDDIAAALDALFDSCPGTRGVVLWGLCDGASAALLYQDRRQDPRVAGLALLNPWVRSAQSASRTLVTHYYAQRLRQPEFWRKLLRGGVSPGAIAEWLRHRRTGRAAASAADSASYQQRMARAWKRFPGRLMLVLSGLDYTAKEFDDHLRDDPAWAGALAHPRLTVQRVAEADHTFSDPGHADQAAMLTARWLAGFDTDFAKEGR
jgi:exosortase A-associated hydrolase 1